MFRITSLVAFIGYSLFFHPNAAIAAPAAQDVYDTASRSIVVIETSNASGVKVAIGSGVVVARNKVITNWHVVENGSNYLVRRKDSNYKADLILDRRDRDLALLNVAGLEAPPVRLAKSNSLKVGQSVYAIGAPLGLELTLTNGLVSALRPVEGGQLIQTSAAISPGSSGGGLFDENALLIGITTLKLSGQAQEGLGFAIPAEWVLQLLEPEVVPKTKASSNTLIGFLALIGLLFAIAFGKRIARAASNRLATTDFHVHAEAIDSLAKPSSNHTPESDELSPKLAQYGLLASREFDSGKANPILIEEAKSKANGLDSQIKHNYILLRAEQLHRKYDELPYEVSVGEQEKMSKSININKKIITFSAMLISGIALLFWLFLQLQVVAPKPETPAYNVQKIWLKVRESSFTDESLLNKAGSYFLEKKYTKAKYIYDFFQPGDHPEVAYHLGLIFANGFESDKNLSKAIEMYGIAASKGHAEANLLLGHAYRLGNGVKPDAKKAVDYYLVAAEKNIAEAQGFLAEAYLSGSGVTLDYIDAYKWAKAGGDAGDPRALAYQGVMLLSGYGIPKNFEEGLRLLEKSADQEFPEALVILAGVYANNEAYKDYKKMEAYLVRAAKAEDPEALYKLGNIYSNGRITTPNRSKAADYFIRSCKKDYGPGCWQLGRSYWYGYGLAADQEEGMKWLRKAMDLGSLDALMEIAEIFWVGSEKFQQNEKYAFDLFIKAATNGRSDSYAFIGVAYLYGRGVSKDYVEALKWLEPVAQKGDSTAQAWLGEMYAYGIGATQDFAKAFDYATKSANSGNKRGKLILAQLYLKGDPNRRDFDKGKSLIREVALTGDVEAIEEMASIAIRGNTVNVGGALQRSEIDMTAAWAWYTVGAAVGPKTYRERLDWLEKSAYPAPDYRRARTLAESYLSAIRKYRLEVEQQRK